jgi:hypothetical protein
VQIDEARLPQDHNSEPVLAFTPTNQEKQPNYTWPCDTVIDRETMFVRLTKEELKNIGVLIMGDKTHYHNISPDGHYDMALTSLPENERIPTHNDYCVWAFSSLSCDAYSLGGPDFYSVIDTLVPVIVDVKEPSIYWFTPTENFFKALPERYQYLNETIKNLKYLKQKCPNKSFVNYWIPRESVFEKCNFLELNKEELIKLQFRITKDKLEISDTKNINRIELYNDSGTSITGISSELGFPPNPYPVGVTDTLGRSRYVFGVYAPEEKVDREYLMKNLNILVAIRINLERIIPPRKETLIFWFYPTDDFINALPENTKYDLKSERDAIINGTQTSGSCTYFEACRSTLPIDDLKVYPNPANQSATIDFSLPVAMNGMISLISISGNQLKYLVPTTKFSAGNNSYAVNLSDISQGVYLIMLSTDKGFKTQRLIVSQ